MNGSRDILRMVDAAGNRTREALRVLEDYARFVLEDALVVGELKGMRHGLAEALSRLPMGRAMEMRDTPGDVGTGVKTVAEFRRESVAEVVVANGKRLSEGLRTLEECAKTLDGAVAAELEKLRYRGYAVEQTLVGAVRLREGRERFRAVRLCVLLTEALCKAGGWEETLDAILLGAAGRGEALCVQLREKELADAELVRRAGIVVAKCREVGAVAMVNDRVDVAMLVGADGVHVGQSDLPCEQVRRLMGAEAIVGVSTGELAEARAAVAGGASYVAVGPMFATTTKVKPRVAGVGYAREVVGAIGDVGGVPVVAIGGITLANVGEVMTVGVRCVAVSSAVVSAGDPGGVVRRFLEVLMGE